MAIGHGLRTASAGLLAALLAFAPDNVHPFLVPARTRAGVASGSGSGSGGGGATGVDPSAQSVFEIAGTAGGGGGRRGGGGGKATEGVVSTSAEWALNRKRRRFRWEQVAPRPSWIPRSRSAATVAFLSSSAGTGVDGGSARRGSRVKKASGEAGRGRGEGQKEHREQEEGKAEGSMLSAGELLVKSRRVYTDNFGQPEDNLNVCAGYAPGRVNLIGEHTDYNGGFVMPLALERGTVVYGVGRLVASGEGGAETGAGDAGWCRVLSENMLTEAEAEGGGGVVSFRADEALSPGEPGWANYVKGVVKEFMAWVPEGKRLEFTAAVVGVVPIGGGVSSSASLSVAMGTFLEGVLHNAGVTRPSPKEKAHLCRMAEHNFLDMPCGIMDQFVTSMAVPGHAMLLDCRSEEPEAVPLSDSNLVIVVTNSNVKHKLAGSQYPVRVAQCVAARDEVQKRHPEVELLRDATQEQVEEIKGTVEEAVFLRARHVVSENARTVDAARALKAGDYETVGGLMLDSHRSLSKDYEVSCPELDILVELAMEVEGVFGSRMTGGGFGGCTVTLASKDSVGDLVRHLREGYARSSGRECSCFVTKPGFGARGLTGADAATSAAWPE